MEISYLAPIVAEVLKRAPPSVKDSLKTSSPAVQQMLSVLCAHDSTSSTPLAMASTLIQQRDKWRLQLDGVHTVVKYLMMLHSVFDVVTTRILRGIGSPILGSEGVNFDDKGVPTYAVGYNKSTNTVY
jgi:hypothetical protein